MTIRFFILENSKNHYALYVGEDGVLDSYLSSEVSINPYQMEYLIASLALPNFEASISGNSHTLYLLGDDVTIELDEEYKPKNNISKLKSWQLIRYIHYWVLFKQGHLGEEFFLSDQLPFKLEDEEWRMTGKI